MLIRTNGLTSGYALLLDSLFGHLYHDGMIRTHQHTRGFSLVELSIVLVILGLLVGGVLSGQSLIRAAELRAVSTEYSRWVTASQSFRDKYFALPGDMNNAISFWGNPTTCPTTAGTGTQTCNGNGDGKIDGPAAASQYGEWFMFWQHLANAGLIEGTYNGRAGSANNADSSAANLPKSKLSNGFWFVAHDASSVAAMFPVATARNNFRVGAPISGSWPGNSIMKPEELWNIDTKLDDGKPGLGSVTTTLLSYGPTCASTSTASSAEYSLSISSTQCIGFMSTGF